uniref:Uncharacterized protein n=1 Tax=Glossina austeni TaxID=7395 RepID=A0A1A9UPR8_GLOAU
MTLTVILLTLNPETLERLVMAQKYWLRQAEVQTTTQILQPFKSCRVPISFNRRQKRNGRAQFTQRLRRFYGVTTFFLVGAGFQFLGCFGASGDRRFLRSTHVFYVLAWGNVSQCEFVWNSDLAYKIAMTYLEHRGQLRRFSFGGPSV